MTRPRLLVVDDKDSMRELLGRVLSDAYELTLAASGSEALAEVGSSAFDLVLTDIRMPGADGFEVLKAVKATSPSTEVVLMTAYASVGKAVEAIKEGAYDYVQKPFDPDELSLVLARALERKRLREQAENLRRELQGVRGYQNLIGKSAAIREVYRLIGQAAGLDITVMIGGESGTGKELVARAIHLESARRSGPFVPVNCGALPQELVESELFGHARGAFTGAAGARPGLFEAAQGGTIFLDEVGELPLQVQVKLNRALQEREVRRVGENAPVKIDVRVITATHRDLKGEAQAGRFREDLYYRLNVFPIVLPPLRDRQGDVALLAGHFLDKCAKQHHRELTGFTPEGLRAITGYPWPGNVRELENAVERAVAVSAGTLITVDDLPSELHLSVPGQLPAETLAKLPYREALDLARDRVSREYLTALLREFNGNITRAAERAGIERESLHRLLRRYGLRGDDFKPTL